MKRDSEIKKRGVRVRVRLNGPVMKRRDGVYKQNNVIFGVTSYFDKRFLGGHLWVVTSSVIVSPSVSWTPVSTPVTVIR